MSSTVVHEGVTFKFSGPFDRITDKTIFWYYVDRFGKPQFDIELWDRLMQRTREWILRGDYAIDVLHMIGFLSLADQDAISAEANYNNEHDLDEYPVWEKFEKAAYEWLATDAGLLAALNYDTARDSFLLPLREAFEQSDRLPISQADFLKLVVKYGYAEEIESE